MDRAEVVAIGVRVADELRIPRRLLLGCGLAEGSLRPDAARPVDRADWRRYWEPPEPRFDVSFGAWQQTVRWSPEYAAWCRDDAPGHDPDAYPGDDVIAAVAAHYLHRPEHCARVAAANLAGKLRAGEDDAHFKALCRYNWPYGNGRPASAQTGQLYRDGLANADAILAGWVEPPPSTPALPAPSAWPYDPELPRERQLQSWTCAIRSTAWVLKSLGVRSLDDGLAGELQDVMVGRGMVSAANGLEDANGYAVAQLLREYLPPELVPHVQVFPWREGNVTWDVLTELATRGPCVIGGRAWGHWSGMRDRAGDVVRLANPARTWQGVGDELDRAEFIAWGEWSAVLIDVAAYNAALAPPAPVEPPPVVVPPIEVPPDESFAAPPSSAPAPTPSAPAPTSSMPSPLAPPSGHERPTADHYPARALDLAQQLRLGRV